MVKVRIMRLADTSLRWMCLPASFVIIFATAGLIEEVVEGTMDENELLETNYPCESTMRRWRMWAEELLRNAEGQLRSVVHRIYDLSYEFLKSEKSLLGELKKRSGSRWLTIVVRIYIDTEGG